MVSLRTRALVALHSGAVTGGLFYLFGALASDLKLAGDFNQETINTIGAVCYTVGMTCQLAVGPLAAIRPRTVIIVCKLMSAMGWGLSAVASWYLPSAALFGTAFGLVSLGEVRLVQRCAPDVVTPRRPSWVSLVPCRFRRRCARWVSIVTQVRGVQRCRDAHARKWEYLHNPCAVDLFTMPRPR